MSLRESNTTCRRCTFDGTTAVMLQYIAVQYNI